MKKKFWISLPILVLLAVCLFACGGSKNSGNNNSGNTGTQGGNTGGTTHISDGFGYDDDKNGVWDDLDSYIRNRYSSDQPKQAALRQMSKAFQAGVKAGNSKDAEAAQKASKTLSKSLYCLSKVTNGDLRVFDEESSLLEVEMLKGDPNRNKAYQGFNALLSGGFYGSDQNVENPCE
jgi:hypothetical protein